MASIKRTDAEWLELVEAQKASGQTRKSWCREHGINYCTMSERIRKLQAKGGAPAEAAAPLGWVKASAGLPPSGGGRVCVAAGPYCVAADAAYPTSSLLALCRGLAR